MWQSMRLWPALTVLLAAVAGVRAEQPAPAAPVRPPTRQELDRQEALRLYGLALLQERDSRLVEAVGTLEQAAKLDPESAQLPKTLVPLYLALDRTDDALQACRKALDIDPGDHDTWFLYARQLKNQGRTGDAIAALEHAAGCASIKEHPDLRLQVYFDLGVVHESAGELDKAAAAFTEVTGLLEKPDAALEQGAATREEIAAQVAETYERLGKVYVRARRFDQAVAAYRKAQEKDPHRAQRLSYNLADVYRGQGKLEDALSCLGEYLKTQPQDTEPYERWIEVLRGLGREKEIVPGLEAFVQRDAQNPALKLLLARQMGQAGQFRDAENRFQEVLADSVSVEAYQGLFALYRDEQGQGPGKALALLDGAVARASAGNGEDGNPADAARARAMLVALRDDAALVKAMLPLARQQLQGGGALRPQTRRLLAVLAARAHQLEDAEKLYRSLLPVPAGSRMREPEIYSSLLFVLWQEHKHAAIVEVCRQGLTQAQVTNRVLFHHDMAMALMQLGKTDAAIAEANNAVDIAPEDEMLSVRRLRALLLAEAGHSDKAVAECEEMRKMFTKPDDVREIHYALSEVYSLSKDYPKAEEELRAILKEHPDEARACNDLGYIMADQGKNLAEAEKLVRTALDLDRKQRQSGPHVEADSDQDKGEYLDSLGWVLFRRGQVGAARKELEKASDMPEGGEDPVVWDHLGDVRYKLKDAAGARAAWQKAVDLYENGGRRRPDDRLQDIKQKLKLLGATSEQR
jgi:tetratricopeptide (TPR) repeat protein